MSKGILDGIVCERGVYQAFTRPSTPPSSSDTVLVSTAAYSDSGPMDKLIDPKGIESRLAFDQLGRVISATEAYQDGDPTTGDADRDRVTAYIYNADGLLAELKARQSSTVNDQITKYIYGTTLGDSGIAATWLLRGVIYPDSDDSYASGSFSDGTDGTYDRIEYKYNRLGQQTERKDQLQTAHAYDYDKLGRPTQDRVTAFGTDVDQTVKRIGRSYDVGGMLTKLSSYDHATVGSGTVLNEVQRAFNSFGQLTSEYQEHSGSVNTSTTLKVDYAYADGSSNSNVIRRTGMTYPNGRAIGYDYGTSGGMDDLLSRIANLKEGTTTLASYTRMGGGGSVRIDLPQPQLRLDLWGGTSGSYAGLDRFNRLVDQHWTNTGTSTDIDQFQYGYDRNSNRVFKDNLLTSLRDEFYTYDSLNRLTSFDRGDLNTGKTAISGTPEKEQDFTLDPLGNWLGFLTKSSGTTDLDQSRTHSKANEISTISESTGPAWADPVHDRGGNMTSVPKPSSPANTYTAIYDAWNRLVEVKEGTDTVVKYKYDATNGRVIKETYSGGMLSETRHYYFSSGWRLLEERVGTSTSPRRQYLWGRRYTDELIFRDRDTNTDGTLDERLYAVQDGNFNVTAITDTSGSVVERYSYSPYGERTILTSSWGSRSSSSYSWEVGHQGLVHDVETGLVANRYRYLHPMLGRFINRDPIGYWAGSMSLYEYVGSSPVDLLDPLGLQQAGDRRWMAELYEQLGDPEGAQQAREAANRIETVEDTAAATEVIANDFGVKAVVIAGIFLPGPEDAILAGILSKYGLKMVCKGGKQVLEKIGGDILKGAEELAAVRMAVKEYKAAKAAVDASAASVADKLQRYLLNPDHPFGGPKAEWFKQALGFTRENADALAKQLVFKESEAIQTAVTQYGTKFNQTINVVGANGKTIPVTTAWIRGSDGVVRLITAVPGN